MKQQVIDTIFAAISVHLGVSEADLKGLIAREPECFQDLAEAWAKGYVVRKQGNGLLPAIIQAGIQKPDEAAVVAFCDGYDLNDKSQEGVATILKNGAYLLKVADKLVEYCIPLEYWEGADAENHKLTAEDLEMNPDLVDAGLEVGDEVILKPDTESMTKLRDSIADSGFYEAEKEAEAEAEKQEQIAKIAEAMQPEPKEEKKAPAKKGNIASPKGGKKK